MAPLQVPRESQGEDLPEELLLVLAVEEGVWESVVVVVEEEEQGRSVPWRGNFMREDWMRLDLSGCVA